MFIGELSRQTVVPAKTIRYYEDLGLLDKPKRTGSDYRIYGQKDAITKKARLSSRLTIKSATERSNILFRDANNRLS